MASSHDQDSDCGGDQGSLRPPKSLPKCLPQAQFMAVQGIGRGRGILEQVGIILCIIGIIQVSCNAFFWIIDTHPPSRTANNVEPYSFGLCMFYVIPLSKKG